MSHTQTGRALIARTGARRVLERLPLAADRPAVGYIVALLAALGAAITRAAVDGVLPPGYPFLTFFPAVILSSFLFGTRPGIVCAVACGMTAWLFFIPPFGGLSLARGVIVSMLFYTFVVTVDIALIAAMQGSSRRLSAERARSETLAETRAVLFNELQHRISNNLQVVAALLTLQKRGITDETARSALDEAARRLGVIGRLHRQLHDPSGAQLGLRPFLDQLATDALDAGGRQAITHRVAADDAIRLEPDAAIPVALIVAEAVANALEHGFADREEGHIDIDVVRSERELRLDVRDNGRGLPDGFDLAAADSLGLRIASMLARQLGGRFDLLHDGHTVARLTLPR